ncbi:CPBP family intramembrane glutamic endopeptidase [Yoonia sp. 208BN28-4]|uniref:CPBP family intramembrane glutamic endopeptidase n=1 Tax=Yoonia sp. 208BN28-4 TaxID=3126505 RepID=UPI0030B1842F
MIQTLRIWANGYPLRAALLAVLLVEVLFVGPYLIFEGGDATGGTGRIGYRLPIEVLVFEWAFVVLALTVVWAFGWAVHSGIASTPDPDGRRAFRWVAAYPLIILMMAMLALVAGFTPQDYLRPFLAIVALNIGVALFEETIFRGILMHGLRSRFGPFAALLLSSVIFGIFHFSNVLAGQDFAFTVFQVLNAFALGLVFGAVYLQTNSLWPPIILHFLWNAAGMTSQMLAELTLGEAIVQATTTDISGLWIYPTAITLIGLLTYNRWQRRVGPVD